MLVSAAIFYILFLVLELLALFTLYGFSKKQGSNVSLNDLTLLIPFKNESKNLPNLLNWFLSQSELPKQVIFINDHSTDSSCAVFDRYKSNDIELVNLPDGLRGKKQAIRFGLDHSTSSTILTMDADVIPSDNYFDTIQKLLILDLNILPVKMIPNDNSLVSVLSSVEYNMLQSLNFLFSKVTILTASGANLVFKKSIFKQVDDYENHKHIESGDDHYLLRAFQSKNIPVRVFNRNSAVVETLSINNWKLFFRQRSRWLGKLLQYSSIKDWLIGVSLFIFFMTTYLILIYCVINMEVFFFLYFFSCCMLFYLIPSIVFHGNLSLSSFYHSFMMTIIYPIIFFLILISTLVRKKSKWK